MNQHAKSTSATAALRRSFPILKGMGVCILISAVTLATGGCASHFQKVCEKGKDPAQITALIKKGANPNARMGASAFTPLQHAAYGNPNPAIIKALIDEGADPNYGGISYTPLQLAVVKNSNPAVVQALIDGGANVNGTLPPINIEGFGKLNQRRAMTPLATAIYQKKPAMADVLRKNGGHE